MRNATVICALASAGMLLSGCSTRARNFSANVSTPVAEPATLENDFRTCQQMVRAGRKTDFKSGAATVLAAGAGAVGTGAAIASTGMVGIGMGGAGAAAAAAMPVVGILAGFGVSRAIRGGKERKYKRAMTACLGEYGYSVDGWTKLHKRDDAARLTAGSATPPGIPLANAAPH